MWFTETDGNKIGRITTSGAISEFTLPIAGSKPQCIVAGPDGAMWFVEGDGNRIGRITTAGVITEFPNIPGGWPQCLAAGPDGALWISDQGPMGNSIAGDGWIGRITTAGQLTKFPLPRHNVVANFITAGPDGAMWFSMEDNAHVSTIGRITMAGAITEFTLPAPNTPVLGITAGPDGALWFAETTAKKIGRITTSGAITEFAVPTGSPSWLVTGPDGALWYTAPSITTASNGDWIFSGNTIGRITTSGAISEFTLPSAGSGPVIITAGADGALWFTEASANMIGKLTFPPSTPTFSVVTTGITAGIITAPTVTTTITVNAADVGKTGSIFITAMMPSGSSGGGARASQAMIRGGTSSEMALVASTTNALVLMQLTPSGWQAVTNGQLIPYFTGVLSDQIAAITLLNNANTASLAGSQFCVGYGTSVTEMNSAGRMQLIGSIPDPNAATAATASCLLISNARVFAFAEANYPTVFTGTAAPGQITYQGSQYDYRYYPASGNYLAVDTADAIYLLGPFTSGALTGVGQVESFRSAITAWETAP